MDRAELIKEMHAQIIADNNEILRLRNELALLLADRAVVRAKLQTLLEELDA